MPIIEGKLQGIRRMRGWSGDFLLVVGEQYHYYYKRVWDNGHKFHHKYNLKTLQDNVGRNVRIEFEEEETKGTDLIIDTLAYVSLGIPRKHREIKEIAYTN